MDNRAKKFLVGQNIYYCKFGVFKNLPILPSLKLFYNSNFRIDPPVAYCSVEVKAVHPLIAAREYIQNGMKPAIINLVSHDFTGGNMDASEGMKDDIMNLRTNFHRTLNSLNLYPVNSGEVVYSPIVHAIRDEMINLNPNTIFKFAMITASVNNCPEILGKSINFDDYCKIDETINTLFQVASNNHDVLILTDFSCKTSKIPIDDIISIYNGCILKYGHLFKVISVAIPMQDKTDMSHCVKFSKDLIKPQEILAEISTSDKQDDSQIDNAILQQIIKMQTMS
jgi:hypothetical protein